MIYNKLLLFFQKLFSLRVGGVHDHVGPWALEGRNPGLCFIIKNVFLIVVLGWKYVVIFVMCPVRVICALYNQMTNRSKT